MPGALHSSVRNAQPRSLPVGLAWTTRSTSGIRTATGCSGNVATQPVPEGGFMGSLAVRRFVPLLVIAGGLLCMFGQTLDTGILGTVADPSGAVIAGAAVSITQT